MNIRHLLNKTVTINRDTTTSDGFGGNTTTPATIATVRAKIDPASARDRSTAGRDADRVTHTGYFEGGVDLVRDDVVDDGTSEYKILSRLPPSSPEHLKAVMEII